MPNQTDFGRKNLTVVPSLPTSLFIYPQSYMPADLNRDNLPNDIELLKNEIISLRKENKIIKSKFEAQVKSNGCLAKSNFELRAHYHNCQKSHKDPARLISRPIIYKINTARRTKATKKNKDAE